MATILRAVTPAHMPQYTVIFLGDSGFYKWGFDRQIRRSFVDYMRQIGQQTNGRVRLFLPCLPNGNYVDINLNVAGSYLVRAGGNRHRARTASTSATTVTKTRWVVEVTFGKEAGVTKISGSTHMVPQQYLE